MVSGFAMPRTICKTNKGMAVCSCLLLSVVEFGVAELTPLGAADVVVEKETKYNPSTAGWMS